MWSFTYQEWAAAFKTALQQAGLGGLGASLYSNRHGGASEDVLTQARSLAGVKARGRWRTDSSLRRYGKEAKLLQELRKLDRARLARAVQLVDRLPVMSAAALRKRQAKHTLEGRSWTKKPCTE